MTSGPHGPYELGYTRITLSIPERGKDESRSKSPNILEDGLISATRNHEDGITSNRGSACRGETSLSLALIARQW